MLTVYTKNQCFYCKAIKKNLDKWDVQYTEINIESNEEAYAFVKANRHNTMPQLYYNDVCIFEGRSSEVTHVKLEEAIERILWPSIDSGIE